MSALGMGGGNWATTATSWLSFSESEKCVLKKDIEAEACDGIWGSQGLVKGEDGAGDENQILRVSQAIKSMMEWNQGRRHWGRP